MFIIMCLVDIFDAYEKVHKGFVDKKHLDIRMNALKFGTMKTDKARSAWDFWKTTRDQEFIDWFESEMLTSVSIMVRSRPTISISLNVDLEQFNS